MTGFHVELPASPNSPGSARGMLAAELVAVGLDLRTPAAEAAILVLSELVTNAVRHSGAGVTVNFSLAETSAISFAVMDGTVEDPAPQDLELRHGGDADLRLVDRFASSWGIRPRTDGASGEVLWASVEVPFDLA